MSWGLAPLNPWQAEFCGCFDDSSSCLLSFCCPCAQYAFNARRINGSGWCGACCLYTFCLCIGCACVVHSSKRHTLRQMYGLQESCCCDVCATCCCPCASLSQETREMKARGPPTRQVMAASPTLVFSSPTSTAYSGGTQQFIVGPNGQLLPVVQPLQAGKHFGTLVPAAVQMQPIYATQPQPQQPATPATETRTPPSEPITLTYAQHADPDAPAAQTSAVEQEVRVTAAH